MTSPIVTRALCDHTRSQTALKNKGGPGKKENLLHTYLDKGIEKEALMESFTHESEDSSSCTQSDGDSTNSSNGTNPFLLCPRGDSLHSPGHGRLHDSAEDIRPYKLARVETSGQLHYHASGLTNSQGGSTIPYTHNVVGGIYGSDGIHRSALLSQARSYASSALEDCRDLPPDFASAGRFQQAALPYIGAAQNYFAQDQWSGLRQQAYVLKPVAPGNTPASTLLLPMSCKVGKMPINFASNAGDFYLGLTDPQPGRCRRTDGKKWRCGRAVVPEQKYCERHMHRGRGRSKAAKLAKITTTVDTNQPHSLGRPLNQPLVQLLSQLTVPIQPDDQPLETGQLPKGAIQPLTWLQKSVQTFQHPHLPYESQPLLTDQPSHFPIHSKPLDWPITQSPMQAEPLHVGQSNGRPAVLAQAIPMNVVSDVKISPDCGSGLTINEASRKRTDDPNDVLNLDVQGIKRLLENAPCNQRSTSFVGKQKQLPNVADLLNVAHIENSNFEPRKPPSLLDVLKMVDPFTSSSMRTSTSPAFHHPRTPQTSTFLPANICQPGQDLPETGQSGTHLSLTLSDEQTSEKQNKQCLSNLPSSLDSVTMQMHNGMMPFKLFKTTYEGWLNSQTQGEYLQPLARDAMEVPLPDSTEACVSQPGNQTCHSSETTNGRQSEERSKKSDGNLINSEKTCLNLMEERRQRAAQLIKGIVNAEDGDSKSEAGTKGPKDSTYLDINSSTQADGQFKYPRSLVQENSSSSRKVNSNHHEYSPKSNSGSLILLEGSLGTCDSSGKSDGFLPRLTEKNLDKHIGADSSDINSLVLVKKRSSPYESYVNLDINIPVLTVKDGHQPGNSDLEKASPSSTPPIENLQTKAPLDRSFSGSSSNASSLSKSTLSLDPVAVSNPELSPHVSLAN